jgi:hypothetical protein
MVRHILKGDKRFEDKEDKDKTKKSKTIHRSRSYMVCPGGIILAPQHGEPDDHFKAKCRIRTLLEDVGYEVEFEHKLPPIPIINKDTMRYTVDILAKHPTLEVMNKYIDIGNDKGDGTYHSSDYNVRHQKLKWRKHDIEDNFKIQLHIFGKDEIEGEFAQPDGWIYKQLGVEQPFGPRVTTT